MGFVLRAKQSCASTVRAEAHCSQKTIKYNQRPHFPSTTQEKNDSGNETQFQLHGMTRALLVEGGCSLHFVCISPSCSLFSPTAAPVTVSQFILTQRDDSSLSVSWLAPRQRSRTSVEYEVMFFEKVRPA